MIEYPRFIAFLRLARPEYDPPSRITLAKYIKLLNKRRLSLSGESVLMQMFLKDNLELCWMYIEIRQN